MQYDDERVRRPNGARVWPAGANDQELDSDTRFLCDVVARDNEAVIQNIDALDNGLIAVAVGVIAAVLFLGDTWSGAMRERW